MTRIRTTPLLCELHAHTTWSDGALGLPELVDLYGRSGFDVLAVTDHTVRTDEDGDEGGPRHVHAGNHAAYLDAIRAEAERARAEYGLLLLPGLELTYDDVDPALGAHAVAVGLERFVGVDLGIDVALERARAAGAALIAAHPYAPDQADGAWRRTARFAACEWQELRLFVDRFELFNRHEFFGWVAEAGLPAVANGDFHRLEHLATWKTMIPCEQDAEAVVEYLRSSRPAYLVQLGTPAEERQTRAA